MTGQDESEAGGRGAEERPWPWRWFDHRSAKREGRRGINEDRWTWFEHESTDEDASNATSEAASATASKTALPDSPVSATARPWRRPALIAGAVTVFGVSLALIAIIAITAAGDSGEAQVGALPTNSPAASPIALTPAAKPDATDLPVAPRTPARTKTPEPTTSLTVAPGPSIELAVWDSELQSWQTGDLTFGAAASSEAYNVPFLLRIDGAAADAEYRIIIQYDCRSAGSPGFDYLTDYSQGLSADAAAAHGGPGRSVPDAAITIPSDPSLGAPNDDGDGQFLVWGATFDGPPHGPSPTTACVDNKRIVVEIRPRLETVYLLWAARADPAPATAPFGLQVNIQGLYSSADPERVDLLPAGDR